MKLYVGVTDNDWYRFLRSRPDLDEVNFRQPGGSKGVKSFVSNQRGNLKGRYSFDVPHSMTSERCLSPRCHKRRYH